jgi:biopolymer transport protein ExbD
MRRWSIILGLVLIAVLAALMVLRPFQRTRPPANVALYVRPDGSAELNGRRFADMAMLQAALTDACGQKVKPMFNLRADRAANFEMVNAVIGAAQEAGCLRIRRERPYDPPSPH